MKSSADTAVFVSAALFLASFVLSGFVQMYELPVSQHDLIEWLSFILGVGGIVLFLSAIVTYRKHR